MDKLKCTNCGGNMTVNKDGKFATCSYCGTKYKLDKDINININLDDDLKHGIFNIKKFIPFMIIPFMLIFVFIIVNIIASNITSNEMMNGTNNIENKFTDTVNDKIEEFDIDRFNISIEAYSGTNSKFLTENLLDKIVTSNKKNADRQITVVYEDKITTNPNEIVDIKYSLTDNDYEISNDYDEVGYINKVTIMKR